MVMIRKIIRIDEKLCDGCGLCADACHEGAIRVIDGKAKLVRDDYCDGLGNCLPVCPTGAISFEEREAAEFDAKAVRANAEKKAPHQGHTSGCPGSAAKTFTRGGDLAAHEDKTGAASELRQWPIQIKLVNARAPWLEGADLLIAADCAAYAHGNFHSRFMRGKITLIGCPKLDDEDYSEKLAEIFRRGVRSVTVARMEVPCCGGIEYAVAEAIKKSGADIPLEVAVISTEGEILQN